LTHNKEIIENLTEDDIETVIPELKKKVLILNGKYKGKTAVL
jgi:hypothetical protein